MKVTLRQPKKPSGAAYSWETCLPFVENKRGTLIHRPVTVERYKHLRTPYLAVHYWCGNGANGHGIFTFLASPPNEKLVCEKCEVAAVLAGLPSADRICGRHVHKGHTKPIQTCCQDAEIAQEPRS
jgi:hypothetical protein